MDPEDPQVSADAVDLLQVRVRVVVDVLVDSVKLCLICFEQSQVIPDDLLKEIIDESFQARKAPFLHTNDAPDDL